MRPIFEYMDYRQYLRDMFEEKKRRAPYWSYRIFSHKAGFKSPNFLKLVIDKKRNLSKESVFRFCKGLRLTKRQSEYFENLVFFNQSRTLEQKNAYLTQLMRYRGKGDPRKIERSEYSYLSEWYHPVVRELVTSCDFGNDYRRLGQAVVPPIGAAEAERSVQLLLDLRFIRRKYDGDYEKTAATLSTGAQVQGVAAANFHKAMIRLAGESIERFGADQRDISSLTLSVSEETYKMIMNRTQQFAMELLKIADADKNSETVAQVNMQVFPVSEPFGSNDNEENA
jgi:uncharacterized protein (TIGR02147 family)